MKRERPEGGEGQDDFRPRFASLPEETLRYYTEIDAHFKSVTDDEEKNLMADNVLEETSGREAEIVPDAVCSRVLEQLIPHASPEVFVKFLEGCSDGENLGLICTSGPFGSHVLEKSLLHLAHAAEMSDENTYALYEGALTAFTDVAIGNLYDMITSKYGSFVARRLVCILSGRDVSSTPQRRPTAPAAQPQDANDGAGDKTQTQPAAAGPRRQGGLVARVGRGGGAPLRSSMGPGFPNLLQTVAKAVLTDEWASEELKTMQCDPFAGPFLQALLRAAAPDSALANRLVIHLLGGSAAAGPDSVTADALYRLLTDRNGSHLMEAAFEAAPDESFQKLCTTAFRGRLINLAQHPCANFGVQAALAAVRKPQQLKRMVEDLSPHLSALLRGRRGGVVAVLLAAAGRLEALQSDCANALWHSVDAGLSGTENATPLHKLLTLDTTTHLSSGGGRLSPLGCATLVSVLQYPAEACKKWAMAIGDLTPGEIATIARDQGGCRVLETYLEGPGGAPKKRKRVLESLTGTWGTIASTGAGVRFVEKCYDYGEAPLKEAIMTELVLVENRLAATPRGASLLQRCNVAALKASGGDWQQKVAAADATRKEFEELFAGGGGGGGGGGTSKKKKKTGAAKVKDEDEEADEEAGDESQYKKKEKGKKEKKKKDKGSSKSEKASKEEKKALKRAKRAAEDD